MKKVSKIDEESKTDRREKRLTKNAEMRKANQAHYNDMEKHPEKYLKKPITGKVMMPKGGG